MGLSGMKVTYDKGLRPNIRFNNGEFAKFSLYFPD